ncbi:MAG: 4Fe-4S binding protein, partial [Pirellulales bacterium]|nr:4Fe-4S binding protein [Pirellulales bacterium]
MTWFPLAFQLLALVVFIMLMIGGLPVNTGDMAFAVVLRNTNVANLIVWSYWWPLIILSAMFLGRVWCAVCPMELVTSLASKVGLKRNPPAFLRSGWVITIFFVIVLFVGAHTLAIHRVPFRMA